MKVIRCSGEKLVLELSKQEKLFLVKILELYPLVPSSYRQLSRAGGLKDNEAAERLLEEAMAEHRADNKRRLRQLLEDPKTFESDGAGSRMYLDRSNLEWLLQILNDIRIGSWISLGSPEMKPSMLNPKTPSQYWVMEIAGFLEASLLHACDGAAGD